MEEIKVKPPSCACFRLVLASRHLRSVAESQGYRWSKTNEVSEQSPDMRHHVELQNNCQVFRP